MISCLFLALVLAYLMSSLVAGPTLTTLAETGKWCGAAGMSMLGVSQTRERRVTSLTVLAWFFVATAILGTLVWLGLFFVESGVRGGRLEFTFQYANATAAWFAAGTLLCLLAPDRTIRSFSALPGTALLLTKSGGGLAVFTLAGIALLVGLVRKDDREAIARTLVQAFVAIVTFGLLAKTRGAVGLAPVLVELACCLLLSRNDVLVRRLATFKYAKGLLVTLVAVGVAVVVVTLRGRLVQSASTMLERMFHIKDGLALWATSPVVGVGPNNWQYLYTRIQTAQYHVSVVHSSYVQTLLDAGIVGFACLVAVLLLGVKTLIKASREGDDWAAPALAASALVLAHSLVDFDLQFCSLSCLLALLLSHPDGPTLSRGSLVPGIMCVALCVPVSGLGLLCSSTTMALSLANSTKDYAAAVDLFEKSPFTRRDANAEARYLEALNALGRYEEAVSAYDGMALPNGQAVAYGAIAYYELGSDEQAATLLIQYMEECPYTTEGFLNAQEIVQRYGLPESLVGRYNDAIIHANELIRQTNKSLPEWQLIKTRIVSTDSVG